jgi:hypothetical protein
MLCRRRQYKIIPAVLLKIVNHPGLPGPEVVIPPDQVYALLFFHTAFFLAMFSLKKVPALPRGTPRKLLLLILSQSAQGLCL